MKEYVENVKEYVKISSNMKEYEKCKRVLISLEKFRAPPSYNLRVLEKFRILPLGPWDLEKFHARASSWDLGLGKISIFIPTSTYIRRLTLGLWKILSFASIQALGFERMLSFPFLRLQPAGEVSLSCLLHISSKLFLLTYSSKFGEATSPNTSREHTTRKLIVVDVPLPHIEKYETWCLFFDSPKKFLWFRKGVEIKVRRKHCPGGNSIILWNASVVYHTFLAEPWFKYHFLHI